MNLNAFKDTAERVVRTAAQAFLGTYGLNLADVTNLSLAQQGAAAAASAVLAALTGLVGSKLGSSNEDASLR